MLTQYWQINCNDNRATVQVADREFVFSVVDAKITKPSNDPESICVHLTVFTQHDSDSVRDCFYAGDYSGFLLDMNPSNAARHYLYLREHPLGLIETCTDGIRTITGSIVFGREYFFNSLPPSPPPSKTLAEYQEIDRRFATAIRESRHTGQFVRPELD